MPFWLECVDCEQRFDRMEIAYGHYVIDQDTCEVRCVTFTVVSDEE